MINTSSTVNQTTQNEIKLDSIEDAVADIRKGKVVIVVDDEDRENEGDFICAADCITPEIINFMATHGRGLICAPIEESRADELGLELMVRDNTAMHETAFTISIDLIGQGCTTGISAYDRSTCIKALVDPNSRAVDFAKPGHIFPLRAKTGGVLRRTGHTEATIDLARMAGFNPAGVLVEILNEDGTMARLPQLVKIAEKHDLKVISIKDLVAYRMRNERLVKKQLDITIPTKYGDFDVLAYEQLTTGDIHLALKKGTWSSDTPVLTRVHSSTQSDNLLGMVFEGFGTRFEKSLEMIEKEGRGLVLVMQHNEHRNSIVSRLKTLQKQLNGDEASPNREMDQRDYGTGAQILRDLNVSKIKLITNNKKRRIGMIGFGLEIVEVVNW